MNSYNKLMQIYVKLEDWHIRQEIRATFYYYIDIEIAYEGAR